MWLSILRQPFPINTWRWYWLRGTCFGLFVFLFLFLFKPFHLDLYSTGKLLYTTGIYGFITGIVIFAGSVLLIKVIAPRINEEKWSLGKQILWNSLLMVCIALLNSIVTQLMYNIWLPAWWYFTMLKWVFMLGVIPVAIAELITYNHYLHRHLKSAAQLSQIMAHTRLVEQPVEIPGNVKPLPVSNQSYIAKPDVPVGVDEKIDTTQAMLLFTGENQSDKLELNCNSLLAVQALDNYVNIFWENNERLQIVMLRNTLTNIADQAADVPWIYRSHRGWLVNTKRVKQVDGNAQGLKLTIDLMQQQVPVSRSNIARYRQVAEMQDAVTEN
ncbi:MAG: LytTR family DNA-binding domain-containing protein [Agriterribacter sp.]